MIYFNKDKEAFGYVIPNYICSIEDSFWHNFSGLPCGYAWDIIDGEFKDLRETETYKKYLEDKEKERIGNLTCTKRVFALMLQELGIDYITQLKPLIESNPQAQLEWELCVELQRGNPLLDALAIELNITSENLDLIFKFANNEITEEKFTEQIQLLNKEVTEE